MSTETNQTTLDTEHLELSTLIDNKQMSQNLSSEQMNQILNESLNFLEKNLLSMDISNRISISKKNEQNNECSSVEHNLDSELNEDMNEGLNETSSVEGSFQNLVDTESKNKNCENSYSSIVEDSARNLVNESLLRLNSKTDSFVYNFTNCILLTLLLTEFYHILVHFERSSFSVFVFNLLMVLFYNSNSDIIVETQVQYLQKLKNILKSTSSFLKNKCNNLFEYTLDYFFSKQTQMMLKIICNLGMTKLKNKYMFYKNSLFNPALLHETNKERVYCIPFYLNGKTYKIPIVENKSSLDSKEPPLMILDNNENEVTQNVVEFMGPNNDFYGMILKPKHLNYKSLVFMMEDGSEMNLLENDMIVL
jgi:hypothetical protein